MKVDSIIGWNGLPYKEGKFAEPGPYEISADDMMKLLESHDVAVWHCYGAMPTRKQRAVQTESLIIVLDSRGGHHRQR